MVKGKVQPSENYIYNKMLPYTGAQQFKSVHIKSTQNRHQLLLQQVQPEQRKGSQTTPLKKSKKSKALKASRAASLKAAKEEVAKGALLARKKTVIMEEAGEYSDSDRDSAFGGNSHINNGTWQEMQEENNAMKDQILNQISIFQQYLKVAILQQKARQKEEAEQAKAGGVRYNSLNNQVFKGA